MLWNEKQLPLNEPSNQRMAQIDDDETSRIRTKERDRKNQPFKGVALVNCNYLEPNKIHYHGQKNLKNFNFPVMQA